MTMRHWVSGLVALGVLASCSSGAPGATNTGTTTVLEVTVASTTTTIEPGATVSLGERELVANLPPRRWSGPVEKLGQDVWLISDFDIQDQLIRGDKATGVVEEILWIEDADLVNGREAGHTATCFDEDQNGSIEIFNLYYWFDGPLHDTFRQEIGARGDPFITDDVAVDGSNVPAQIFENCGQPRVLRLSVTAMQFDALLRDVGFTDIAGDHAVDPNWAAVGSWNGQEFWMAIHQGDFQLEPDAANEVLDCRMGQITAPRNLPADASAGIVDLAGCEP